MYLQYFISNRINLGIFNTFIQCIYNTSIQNKKKPLKRDFRPAITFDCF